MVLLGWDLLHLCLYVLIELVLGHGYGAEGGGTDAKDFGWSRGREVEVEHL